MPRIPDATFPYRHLLLALWWASVLCAPSAHAQDREAPPQGLASDPAPPLPRGAATVDPVGMAFGEWTARVEVALLPAHALFLDAGYRDTSLSSGLGLELGYHLFPLGDGLEGPFLGPSIGVALTTDRGEATLFGAVEAGYQLALGSLALALSGGVEVHVRFGQAAAALEPAPRVSVSVGYVLR